MALNHRRQFFRHIRAHVKRSDKDQPSLLINPRPHGPDSSSSGALWGGRGPGLCYLLPLSSLLFPAGDGDEMCPDGGGSLWIHLHLHLSGGADHLRQRSQKHNCENSDSTINLTHHIHQTTESQKLLHFSFKKFIIFWSSMSFCVWHLCKQLLI